MQNEILKTTRFVFENSEFVKINHDKVSEFSKKFNDNGIKHWLDDAPFNFSHFSEDDKLHFLFIFNALSFSYWGDPKWTVEFENKKNDGAWGMIVALGRAVQEGVPILDFKFCSEIDKKMFDRILRANTKIPLLDERRMILREISNVIVEKYKGKLSNLINEANGDAIKLLDLILQNFPSFQDEAIYKGNKVYFEKRAQLLVSDIFQIFKGNSYGNLKNIGDLTACADYKLPQILRKLGIFSYRDDLAKKIDNKNEISHNSQEEIEIRANTIWAVEFIKEEVKKRNPKIMSLEINDHLWLVTQEKFPGDKPYHLTRTTAY